MTNKNSRLIFTSSNHNLNQIKMKAYHKTFGAIEILEKNEKTTTIKILATDETKKLATSFANVFISEHPFSENQINVEKMTTELKANTPINFDILKNVAIKHNLVLVNYQGDYITLNFPEKTPKKQNITDFGVGIRAAFVTENSCNYFELTDGISFEEIRKLQPVFNELANI